MRTPNEVIINGKTLDEILERHQHWVYQDCVDWENMCANLSSADLHEVDFRIRSDNALFSYDTRYPDTINIYNTDLRCANLSGANLYGANLGGINMAGANLFGADLRCAILYNTVLTGANLCRADLRGTNLTGANMTGVNLWKTSLDFNDKLRKGIKLSEPMIGWKKCKYNVLVKLEIPKGAIVFSINNNKCRTDKAKVLEIIGADRAYSTYKYFSYYVGDMIEVSDFNYNYNIECAEGIHFFRRRQEAENY